jgi:hypothetical protein
MKISIVLKSYSYEVKMAVHKMLSFGKISEPFLMRKLGITNTLAKKICDIVIKELEK